MKNTKKKRSSVASPNEINEREKRSADRVAYEERPKGSQTQPVQTNPLNARHPKTPKASEREREKKTVSEASFAEYFSPSPRN